MLRKSKKAVKGTLTSPKGGGDPTFEGEFVTPEHPDGASFNDLKDSNPDSEREKLKKKLLKMFEEEKVRVDKFSQERAEHASLRNDSAGNLIGSLIRVSVAMDAPAEIRAGEAASFSATATTALGPTEVESWNWDFGNGKGAEGKTVSTTFDRPGSYLITVNVRDYAGARGSVSRYVEVRSREETAPPMHKFSSQSESANGITTFTFSTEDDKEKVLVYITEDLSLGDTFVVGHVTGEAKGGSREELTRNTAEVTGTVAELGTQRTPINAKTFQTIIPAVIQGGSLYLLLHDQQGREVGRATVPVKTAQTMTAPPSATASDYVLPQAGIAGHPLACRGIFTEHSTMAIGNQGLQPFVASPRTLAVVSPADVVGPTTISVSEGDIQIQKPFRNLAVETELDRSELAKSQQTTLRITVRGLQNLTAPVTLNLVNYSPSVVTIEKGDRQQLVFGSGNMMPSAEGIAVVTRKIRAAHAGDFRIEVTLPQSGGSGPTH